MKTQIRKVGRKILSSYTTFRGRESLGRRRIYGLKKNSFKKQNIFVSQYESSHGFGFVGNPYSV